MQRKRGFTLVEVIVVMAILLTLAGMLWPAFSAAASSKPEDSAVGEPPKTHRLWTVQHDGHWWVMSCEHFLHHPDCPCVSRKAESEMK